MIIDLKIGAFTHADAGQMNLYLNYAREHWMHAHENPPIGLILCSEKDAALPDPGGRYAGIGCEEHPPETSFTRIPAGMTRAVITPPRS